MKTIRFWTSHPDKTPKRWLSNFELDESSFDFVYDAVDPDYLFATEHIYISNLVRDEFTRLCSDDRVMIYYADECIYPDMNVFDYAVSFDFGARLGDRLGWRHPLAFSKELFSAQFPREGLSTADRELASKVGFCNFIYSNPAAHPRRDEIFHALSRYKKVDALGSHLNNVGNKTSRAAENWGDLLVEMKRPYKFSIACENARYPGYVTEKILSSFMARTVPIYWGDPNCTTFFNSKAFVDANNFSDEDLLEVIREIDQNDARWREMVSEKPMTDDQYETFLRLDAEYKAFARHIFEQPKSKAKRAPSGYWPDNYRRQFVKARAVALSRRERLFSLLGRETRLADWLIRMVRG